MRSLLIAASLWLAAVCSHAAEAPPRASAFVREPAMESLALSPNGQQIAWIANAGGRPTLQVLDLAGGKPAKRVEIPGDLQVRGLDWADDQILLIHAVFKLAHRTLTVDVATGKSSVLSNTDGDPHYAREGRLVALRTGKPHTVITSARGGHAEAYAEGGPRTRAPSLDSKDALNGLHLYEVDTRTGAGALIEWGRASTLRWVVDADGKPIARSDFAPRWKLFTVSRLSDSKWVEIFRMESGEQPELLGLTPDGASILMRARLNREYPALWKLELNGKVHELALGDDLDSLTRLVRDPYSQQVIGAWTNGLTPQIRWLDEKLSQRAASLQKTFGGKDVELIGRSADGDRVLAGVGAHAAPVTYYLVDFKRGAADIVGEQHPDLIDVSFGEVRALTYKARDGYEAPAYLTLPPGRAPAGLPMVVLPHDGPDFRDETQFDPMAQFLASRGYAVLQPQFRGSTGFGEAHRKAGVRQWGGLMQNDVTDGVRAMIEQGVADSKRVCIVGTGYGGYAALAGVAFTPDLYACAISINGTSDLPSFLDHLRRVFHYDDVTVDNFEKLIGDRKDPRLADVSPVRAASNVKAPVLLIHGADSIVRPVAQSREMMNALGGRPPHELVELTGEAQWSSDSATRIRLLTEIERFLAKHLPAS